MSASQPPSRHVKALRLREPLMQRQVARRLERRRKEDEAWARTEEEELLRKEQGQRGGGEQVQQDTWIQDQERELEARMRQARNEQRRKMNRAADRRPISPTGRRRPIQGTAEYETARSESQIKQTEEYVREQYVKQRLARKLGGFADIVAMTAKQEPNRPLVGRDQRRERNIRYPAESDKNEDLDDKAVRSKWDGDEQLWDF